MTMSDDFIDKARENLCAAHLLFEHGYYNASANRAYYAVFHLAIARLAQHGFINEKQDHSWVQAMFAAELVHKAKIYPGRIKAVLLDMQTIRNRADYKTESLSQTVAARQLAKADEFATALNLKRG